MQKNRQIGEKNILRVHFFFFYLWDFLIKKKSYFLFNFSFFSEIQKNRQIGEKNILRVHFFFFYLRDFLSIKIKKIIIIFLNFLFFIFFWNAKKLPNPKKKKIEGTQPGTSLCLLVFFSMKINILPLLFQNFFTELKNIHTKKSYSRLKIGGFQNI